MLNSLIDVALRAVKLYNFAFAKQIHSLSIKHSALRIILFPEYYRYPIIAALVRAVRRRGSRAADAPVAGSEQRRISPCASAEILAVRMIEPGNRYYKLPRVRRVCLNLVPAVETVAAGHSKGCEYGIVVDSGKVIELAEQLAHAGRYLRDIVLGRGSGVGPHGGRNHLNGSDGYNAHDQEHAEHLNHGSSRFVV